MEDLTGKQIGRYQITAPIGVGGMAYVYRAVDTALERDVAIKFIKKDAFAEEQYEKLCRRFMREARIIAKLRHPNIVKLYDVGEYEGSPFIVMELLDGVPLRSLMGVPIPYKAAASLLIPISDALDYIHSKGLLHRDVKPANIMILRDKTPVLTDFGIARSESREGESMALTATGFGIGTPDYMSPEQAIGSNVDGRTDEYAMGVILYEMITGKRIFSGRSPMEIIYQHQTCPVPAASDTVPEIPPAVDAVIRKALAKKAADRYPTMGDFTRELKRIVRSGGQTVSPVPAAVVKEQPPKPILQPEAPVRQPVPAEEPENPDPDPMATRVAGMTPILTVKRAEESDPDTLTKPLFRGHSQPALSEIPKPSSPQDPQPMASKDSQILRPPDEDEELLTERWVTPVEPVRKKTVKKDSRNRLLPIIAIAAAVLLALIIILLIRGKSDPDEPEANEPPAAAAVVIPTETAVTEPDPLPTATLEPEPTEIAGTVEDVPESEPTEVPEATEMVPMEEVAAEDVPANTEIPEPAAVPAETDAPEQEGAEAELTYGSLLTFGRYEQDNDLSNGPENVEWTVLAVEDDRILVVSRYVLDSKPYHSLQTGMTWEKASLREWLNGEFTETVFTEDEQSRIIPVLNPNPANPDYGTDGGADTEDRMFLLSFDEVEKYFRTTPACAATDYAEAMAGDGSDGNSGNVLWWLRTPGGYDDSAAVVNRDGSIFTSGYIVFSSYVGVRPAFWLRR